MYETYKQKAESVQQEIVTDKISNIKTSTVEETICSEHGYPCIDCEFVMLHLCCRVICTVHAVNFQEKKIEFHVPTNWISSPVAYLLSQPSRSFSIADQIQMKVRVGQHKMHKR